MSTEPTKHASLMIKNLVISTVCGKSRCLGSVIIYFYMKWTRLDYHPIKARCSNTFGTLTGNPLSSPWQRVTIMCHLNSYSVIMERMVCSSDVPDKGKPLLICFLPPSEHAQMTTSKDERKLFTLHKAGQNLLFISTQTGVKLRKTKWLVQHFKDSGNATALPPLSKSSRPCKTTWKTHALSPGRLLKNQC